MNKKKFFGLLTSAAMLLNAAPLSVLAEEMVEASGVVGAVTNADGTIAIDKNNFPDADLLQAIKDGNPGVTDAAKVTTVTVPSTVEDLSGLQYLTGLETFTMIGNANIETLNLTANTDLVSATVQNNVSLYSVTLPETQTLESITITGNPALTSLDLSPASVLKTADIHENAIAQLDVSSNTFLNELCAYGNKLYSIDTTNCPQLTTLNLAGNKIYEMKLVDKAIVTLNLAGNKLRTFDGSKMTKLTSLNLEDNMLETVQLPEEGNITSLNVNQNHLAALDLSEVVSTKANAADIITGTQSLFAGSDDEAIDLKAYDDNFKAANSDILDSNGNATGNQVKNGILTLATDDDDNQGGNTPTPGPDNPTPGPDQPGDEKDKAEVADVALQAKFAKDPDKDQVTVVFNPSLSDLGAEDIENGKVKVETVTGTATVEGNPVTLTFEEDKEATDENTWVATPAGTPESSSEVVDDAVNDDTTSEEPGANDADDSEQKPAEGDTDTTTPDEGTGSEEEPGTDGAGSDTDTDKPSDGDTDKPAEGDSTATPTPWTSGTPENIVVKGTVVVTGDNIEATTFDFTIGGSGEDALTTEFKTADVKEPSSDEPGTDEPGTDEPTTAIDLSKADVVVTYTGTAPDYTYTVTVDGKEVPASNLVITADGDPDATTGDLKVTVSAPEGSIEYTGSASVTATTTPEEPSDEDKELTAAMVQVLYTEENGKVKAVALQINEGTADKDNWVTVTEDEEALASATITFNKLTSPTQANIKSLGDITLPEGYTWPASGLTNVVAIEDTSTALTVDNTTVVYVFKDKEYVPVKVVYSDGTTPIDLGVDNFTIGKVTWDTENPTKGTEGTVATLALASGTSIDVEGSTYTLKSELDFVPAYLDEVNGDIEAFNFRVLYNVGTDGAITYEIQFNPGATSVADAQTNEGWTTIQSSTDDTKAVFAAPTLAAGDTGTDLTITNADNLGVEYAFKLVDDKEPTSMEEVPAIQTYTLTADMLSVTLEGTDPNYTIGSVTVKPTAESKGEELDSEAFTLGEVKAVSKKAVLEVENADALFPYIAKDGDTFTVSIVEAADSSSESGESTQIMSELSQPVSDSVLAPVNAAAGYQYNTDSVASKMNVYVYKEAIMNRLYNPNSGEHFYTQDTNEKNTLVKLGWQYEGVGWVAPKAGQGATAPVYRLYNKNAGDHHYTKDAHEKDTLVTIGWTFEGVGWYSAADPEAYDVATGETGNRTIEVFREYNPNAEAAGAHNYTISENENVTLVSIGWIDEGIAWNALK